MYFDSTTINFPLPIDAYISTSLCRTSHHIGPMNQFKLHTAQLKYICVCSVGLFGRSWNPNKSINFGLRCASNNFCNNPLNSFRFSIFILSSSATVSFNRTWHEPLPLLLLLLLRSLPMAWKNVRVYSATVVDWMNGLQWRKASKWKLNNSLHTQIPLFVRI